MTIVRRAFERFWISLARYLHRAKWSKPQRAGLPNGVTAREPDCFDLSASHNFFSATRLTLSQMTNERICSNPNLQWRASTACTDFGSNGEIMAANLHRADGQPDITGSVLEQELESLHSRAGIEDLDMRVSCGLLIVVPAELCGGDVS